MPDVFETIDNLRAAWRFKPDPVPDDAIRTVLRAATRAASGGNAQPWRFVVVRDAAVRRQIGALYLRAWNLYRPATERMLGGVLPPHALQRELALMGVQRRSVHQQAGRLVHGDEVRIAEEDRQPGVTTGRCRADPHRVHRYHRQRCHADCLV